MADVLLSYAREDQARAQQLAQGLEANGVSVFWDSEIPPGATWADHIEQKLSDCKAQVVLWSAASAKSQWVREEARMGRDKGILIPAMIDATPAPFGFGEVQAADLSSWNGEADHGPWRRFVEAVQRVTAAAPATEPMGAPQRAAPAPAQPTQGKKAIPVWVWVAGAVAAAIIVLGLIGLMAPDAPQPAQQAQPAIPQPAQGPDYAAQIQARLSEAELAFTAQGFVRIGEATVGQLRQGQSFNVPATLEAGAEYRIVGVCDNDCGDLDLVLYDEASNLISQDNLVDAYPVVAVSPQWTGPFTVQAVMHQCTVEPCFYALALYARPRR